MTAATEQRKYKMTFSEESAELIAERDQLRSKLLKSELTGSLLLETLKVILPLLDDAGLSQTAASARKAIADVTGVAES